MRPLIRTPLKTPLHKTHKKPQLKTHKKAQHKAHRKIFKIVLILLKI